MDAKGGCVLKTKLLTAKYAPDMIPSNPITPSIRANLPRILPP